MPQEQSQKSGEPPIGECAVCGEPVTREDPGTLKFSLASGAMTHVHTRCESVSDAGGIAS
jgi:hypothetical protein